MWEGRGQLGRRAGAGGNGAAWEEASSSYDLALQTQVALHPHLGSCGSLPWSGTAGKCSLPSPDVRAAPTSAAAPRCA